MRNTLILALATTLILSCSAQSGNGTNDKKVDMTNETDRASYSLGVLMANNLKRDGFTDLNVDAMAKGVADVLEGTELQIDAQTAQTEWQNFIQAQLAKAGEGSAEAGIAFLAENGKREGVVTTESGLQYEILKKGDGPKPGPTDKVKTHYHGTLIDGTVFDSSVERGEPISFPVNGVIKGWTEALQLMPVGSKWKLFIPSDLAYGPRGAGNSIGPNETLIFEVELLAIEK